MMIFDELLLFLSKIKNINKCETNKNKKTASILLTALIKSEMRNTNEALNTNNDDNNNKKSKKGYSKADFMWILPGQAFSFSPLSSKAIYLHVLWSNVEAIRFYEAFGFERVKRLDNYYMFEGDGPQHAYLYCRYINGGEATPAFWVLFWRCLDVCWWPVRWLWLKVKAAVAYRPLIVQYPSSSLS